MWAAVGVEAGVGQAEALDGAAADKVLVHDFVEVAGFDEAVPDGFGVDHNYGAVLALVEAAGLVDADAMFQAGSFYGVFQFAFELFAVFMATTGAGGGFVALIEADENVMVEFWHVFLVADVQQGLDAR